MPSYEVVGYGSPDGLQVGASTSDKIGFYGATPYAKQTLAQQATKTSTQLRAEITALQDALVNLGLISVT